MPSIGAPALPLPGAPSFLTLLALAAAPLAALSAQDRPTPLAFHGLRPAMTRLEADSAVARYGAQLRCQATREPRIQACSATARLEGEPVAVTITLVDGRVAIALVAGRLPADHIADWYATLTRQYGDAEPQQRPGQESFQWLRARQMLRLTVRREAGGLTASVSLVDGMLLDGLPSP